MCLIQALPGEWLWWLWLATSIVDHNAPQVHVWQSTMELS